MVKYFKRFWDEERADEYSEWGTSMWYFETDNEGWVIRQIVIYENGNILKNDEDNNFDKFGGLSDQALPLDEFQEYEIPKEEFEKKWLLKSLNNI